MRTYGYYVDETKTDDVTSAVIGLYRDGVAYKDTSSVSLSTANEGANYYVNEAAWWPGPLEIAFPEPLSAPSR